MASVLPDNGIGEIVQYDPADLAIYNRASLGARMKGRSHLYVDPQDGQLKWYDFVPSGPMSHQVYGAVTIAPDALFGGKVEHRVEREHSARVAEARTDERTADDVAAAIERRVTRSDDLTTAALQATVKDLRDAIDAVPPAAAGAAPPPAPVDSLRDTLNAGIDRANRAAAPADAAR